METLVDTDSPRPLLACSFFRHRAVAGLRTRQPADGIHTQWAAEHGEATSGPKNRSRAGGSRLTRFVLEHLAAIAIRLCIADGAGVGPPFVNRSGNEASRNQMKQKHEHEAAGKSEHEPSHVCVWIEQGVEHEYPI
jgi:hypothetical protein